VFRMNIFSKKLFGYIQLLGLSDLNSLCPHALIEMCFPGCSVHHVHTTRKDKVNLVNFNLVKVNFNLVKMCGFEST
jgi:hypothetical protein